MSKGQIGHVPAHLRRISIRARSQAARFVKAIRLYRRTKTVQFVFGFRVVAEDIRCAG